MTPASLQEYTCKDLAQMAKRQGVRGWHAMRKDQLIEALIKQSRRKSSSRPKTEAKSKSQTSSNGSRNGAGKRRSDRVRKQIGKIQAMREEAKDLSTPAEQRSADMSDRLIVMVRDPFWLHAYWDLTRQSVARVRAALGQRWHNAQPVLQVYEVTALGGAATSETHVRTIEIHGGVNNWYVDVANPPSQYRLDIGYRTSDGDYQSIARSNTVQTPRPAASDALDENWTDVAEKLDQIYAMSGGYAQEGASGELKELLEERLRRPMGAPVITRYGAGAASALGRKSEFCLEVDAELIVFGTAPPDSYVTLKGEPLELRSDGTFTIRMKLPDRRQVIPVQANSKDGSEQRTAVLAVERNTKWMEAISRDGSE